MDEPEPSWTIAIRSAVKQFVEAVNESSKQLAGASERFAVESLQAMDSARIRSEQSAETSAEMARRALEAANLASNASSSLQAAIDEAREQIRSEARQTVEQVAAQTARLNEVGAQVQQDMRQRIEEMIARLEAGTAGHKDAVETANAATAAAQAAAERIEMSVNAVESALAGARRAAEEARTAATQSEQNLTGASQAVASALEAAEASRQSASLAEQAGKRSDFAAEASMLLERLETDYSLLTRLVQELHNRISSLGAVSTSAPAPVYQPVAQPGPDYDAEPPIEAYEEESEPEPAWAEPVYEEVAEQPAAEPEPQPLFTAEPQTSDNVEPQPMSSYTPEPSADATSPSSWPMQAPVDLTRYAAEINTFEEKPAEPAFEAPAFETAEPAYESAFEAASQAPEPPSQVTPDMGASSTASIAIFGRVQMTIAPVPDFDKLLSLDSALARISGVHSVTLADYAREEVVFRVELEKPVSVVEFARQLSETAGVPTEVTEASESTLSIRIG